MQLNYRGTPPYHQSITAIDRSATEISQKRIGQYHGVQHFIQVQDFIPDSAIPLQYRGRMYLSLRIKPTDS